MREDRVSRAGKALLTALGASLSLAGCVTEATSDARLTATGSATDQVQPGAIRTGAQTSGMAAVYAAPRLGPVAAAGASAWLPPAPEPAFVLAAPPTPVPSTPAPAAVANRQPASSAPAVPAPVDASQIVRPEAATPEAAPAPAPAAAPSLSATTREEGRKLFANYSCGTCHGFADAGAAGSIGPSLDNPTLTQDYVHETIEKGRGAMPSFAGQMSEAELTTLASYIVGARRR